MKLKFNTITWTAWMLTGATITLLSNNPANIILLSLILLASAKKHHISTSNTIKAAIFFSIPLLLINVLFVHEGQHILTEIPADIHLIGIQIPITPISGPITLESVSAAFLFSILLLNTLLLFTIYNKETSIDNVLRLIPTRLSHSTLLIAIALRFIPTITQDAQAVTEAQRCRGLIFQTGSLANRIKANSSVMIPTFVNSLERSYVLAEALESRGYSKNRTRYLKEDWSLGDWILSFTYLLSITYLVSSWAGFGFPYWNNPELLFSLDLRVLMTQMFLLIP